MTTHGPTRRQVLIPFEGNIIADRIKDFNKASEFCNRGLIAAQSKLRVESVRESYNGISIATSSVASSSDLDTIKSWLKKAWQLGDAIPIEPRLPQSKSFLKIVGVPYWVSNSSNPLSPAFVEQALGQSSLFENVILAARPRVMKSSPKSDTAVVWFDIWDSQNGTKAKTLVNRTINFGRHIGTIRATSMHPGVAQCRNCWRWGHPTHACRALGARCQICGGPHRVENHRSMAWCCKANPKSSPPRDATPDGIPCPHLENFKCLNCKGDHHANDNKCPFWRNRFDRTWHSNKAAESRTARANNLISSVRIYSQNVGRSYALVDTILESRKLDFDIIFIQEPPWNHIRKAPSTTNPEGDDVIGAPIHPEWLCMARPTKPNDPRPRTLTYVHRRLSHMRPILRQEWVNHRDIQILGLFNKGNYIHLLNVYSDLLSSAINFLSTNFVDIPNIIYMGGDFNCRSPEWDPLASHVSQSAITLTELVECFNLSRSEPTVFSPTHFSPIKNFDNTVIDLIFCANASISHIIDANSRLPSDHAPLLMDLPIHPDYINYKKRVLPKDSDEESAFISQVSERLAVLDCSNIISISCLDNISHSISSILSDSWNSNSKTVWITNRSKEWWTPHCSETLIAYRKSKSRKDWQAFRKATRVAKRSFFDERIHEIASTNKRPWDLMEWVKQRKLPAIEGIRYQGRPCNDLPDLWNALHSSYNSASGRPVSPQILNEMKSFPSRSWANFSALELSESLRSCANSSAPGPDHISWKHLKSIIAHNDCLKNIILIANACKRLLYRSCVVPVATYGFRLWHFEGARNKALLKSLSSMQRHAAIWITGAFRTSPSGGVESIAGLIPIHLHLRKLAIRSSYRVSTLPSNHALRSLLSNRFSLDSIPHPQSLQLLTPAKKAKVKGPIIDVDNSLSHLSDSFLPFDPVSKPGSRLMDIHSDSIHFHPCNRSDKHEMYKHVSSLDSVFTSSSLDRNCISVVTDASVPLVGSLQAVSAAHLYRGGRQVSHAKQASGRASSTDAELYSIRIGIAKAISLQCDHIILITDCLPAAKLAVDPSIHSSQSQSIQVCRLLFDWLSAKSSRSIDFWDVPSKWRWKPHLRVHNDVTSTRIHAPSHTGATLDFLRHKATNDCQKSWETTFWKKKYRGNGFLLSKKNRKFIIPTYVKGGMWLPLANESPQLCARMTRAILNHAPIGAYRERFFPLEQISCRCGHRLETRHHILSYCPLYPIRTQWVQCAFPQYEFLVEFLKKNPAAFAFTNHDTRPPPLQAPVPAEPNEGELYSFISSLLFSFESDLCV
ncbi:hypothetical protein D9756_011012 [Leucocoprinus leucothites]|uniref:Endonuclease/exonuclease/phosphatase domain-containing protein n=1 Tax=Leucocoprinus leucothites TaxID=201217 RepID=A0A8H5CSG5_9AGAR|nr:hypothetical protein D9756_011012 [Leucoagaricus leucothites]